MNTITHNIPVSESEKLDQIHSIGMVLDSRERVEDWAEAVALAVDAYRAGCRQVGGSPAVSLYRLLADHNPSLWTHLRMRKTAVKAFTILLANEREFAGVPI